MAVKKIRYFCGSYLVGRQSEVGRQSVDVLSVSHNVQDAREEAVKQRGHRT